MCALLFAENDGRKFHSADPTDSDGGSLQAETANYQKGDAKPGKGASELGCG